MRCIYDPIPPFHFPYSSPVASPSFHREESASEGTPEADNISFEWDPVALELMHNYSTATCFTLSDNPMLQSFSQLDLPNIGFSQEHVLRLILSLSAIHLSRFRPTKQTFYLAHAEKHYQAGFRIASRLLQDRKREDCQSLLLFATMCNIFRLAKGPSPGDSLFFDNNGPAEWISLFRGIKPLLEIYSEDIQNGILSSMIQAGISLDSPDDTQLPEPDQLGRLRVMIDQSSSSQEDSQTLNNAVDNLNILFSPRIGSDGQRATLSMQSVGFWFYRCSYEFAVLLQKRHPAALTILAHACCALNDLSSNWLMAGWAPHLLAGIWEDLPPRDFPWIRWPIQQIGWIPPFEGTSACIR
jgi:hypothetical protein